MDKQRLMEEIKDYDFTVVELALYLDTHPTDQKALDIYSAVSEKLESLKEKYEHNYGPLTICGVKSGERWTWVDGPWPWE